MYQELADIACNRITAAITQQFIGTKPIKALLDPYNPTGSTAHVRFSTSRTERWETSSKSCHVNWVVLDSDWEAEFCRVAESHPRVRAYVKNHNLGLDVPYRFGSEIRTYRPDFIVLVDDGRGIDDLLHLVIEIKGYRREDAKEKKATMDTYWVPGVNNIGTYGRWAFAEFTEVYRIEPDFEAKIESTLCDLIDSFCSLPQTPASKVEELLSRTFGKAGPLHSVAQLFWKTAQNDTQRGIVPSDIDRLGESAGCDADDALGVLAILARPSAGVLRMELFDPADPSGSYDAEAFIRELRESCQKGKAAKDTWNQWARSIRVRWVVADGKGEAQ
jgi:hypothetical protein